jgi:phage/plasmid-like protein (TIGR03299 family)
MAHDINSMVYTGKVPWHGLGQQLPSNGTWEEIREAAGFYSAEERDLFLADGTRVPDRKALVRGDTGRYLSTVSTGYEVLQFEDLARAGVLASGDVDAIWHTAGTLGESGSRGWLLAELPNPIRIHGDSSELRKFVLLTTAHDGSSAAVLKNVATRVVCSNTLGAALSENHGAEWRITHTRNAHLRLEAAGRAFRALSTHFDRFGELADVMARTSFSESQHRATIREVLPFPDDDRRHPRLEFHRQLVEELYETFRGSEGLRGTAWGAWQAWTEWADHERVPSTRTTDLGWQMESATLGAGARVKARALSAILTHSSIRPLALAA